MKTTKFQRRIYREWVKADDLVMTKIVAEETDLEILTDKPLDISLVEELIRLPRWDIENYINRDRKFLSALKPVPVELNCAAIIKRMGRAAELAGTGPMSAVAGAIAEVLGRELLKKGFKEVIVENGGDIFLKSSKVRFVGVYSGRHRAWNKLKLKIYPKDTPVGICSSSGKIGHSLSFGSADCVVVISKNAALADAAATAVANRVNSKKDMQKALDFARAIPGIKGVLIIVKDSLATWGRLTQLAK